MHDINGKPLKNGDNVYSPAYGMLIIKEGKSEHDHENGGSLIECIGVARGGQGIELRTHDARVVKVRTWKELASMALLSSNACNLTAVVGAFAQVIQEVRYRLESEAGGGVSNDDIFKHPVCVIFSQTIGNITGSESMMKFGDALDWARKMAPEDAHVG